ncbi:MAG: hypothetical protein LQ348_001897 [Seirophora lacunosa]|nr:MAG: hypothetical protein LQ348_001897 [Seirophora lacunosa]
MPVQLISFRLMAFDHALETPQSQQKYRLVTWEMSESHLSTITKILIMDEEQLDPSRTMRSFLHKCLHDSDIAIELDNSHHLVKPREEATTRLLSLSDQGTCSVFNSRLKKLAWFRAWLRFLDTHHFPPVSITQETLRASTPRLGTPPFEVFVRSILANPTEWAKREVAGLVRAGARYDFLCWGDDSGDKCTVNEGHLFLLPASISADQWEHDLSAGELVQARTHLHHLGIQSIAESFSDRSSTLCEVARRVMDRHTVAINSSHDSCSFPAHTVDPNLTQATGKKDNDAPSRAPANTFEPLSSTHDILLLSPKNDALAADAQLQRELLQAIPHGEQLADDLKQVGQLIEAESSSESAAIAPESQIQSVTLGDNPRPEQHAHEIKATGPSLQTGTILKLLESKKTHSPTPLPHPQHPFSSATRVQQKPTERLGRNKSPPWFPATASPPHSTATTPLPLQTPPESIDPRIHPQRLPPSITPPHRSQIKTPDPPLPRETTYPLLGKRPVTEQQRYYWDRPSKRPCP